MAHNERIALLKQQIEDLKQEADVLKNDANYADAVQQALKLILNGSYGAFANKYFSCFSNAVAAAITAQGRELIKYMSLKNQEYWRDWWPVDWELHDELANEFALFDKTKVAPLSEEDIKKMSIYIDTDSLFINFGLMMYPLFKGTPDDGVNFVLAIYNKRIEKYFNNCLEVYCASYHVPIYHNFALERVNESALFMGKKRYIQHVRWEDGHEYKELEYLYPKGIELVKSSTPVFAREKLLKLVNYIMTNPTTYNQRSVHIILKELKEEFKIYCATNIEDVCLQTGCSKYNEMVINDTTELKIKTGAHFGVVMAAHTNFLLNRNPLLKNKYNLIRGGDKIKYYVINSHENEYNYFAFLRGQYPMEIALPIDIDAHFEKTILSVLNSIIVSIGLKPFDKKLSFRMGLNLFE